VVIVDKPGAAQTSIPDRRRRRAALDERLLPAAGDEHDLGGSYTSGSIRICAETHG
jgi:hypothetical protein